MISTAEELNEALEQAAYQLSRTDLSDLSDSSTKQRKQIIVLIEEINEKVWTLHLSDGRLPIQLFIEKIEKMATPKQKAPGEPFFPTTPEEKNLGQFLLDFLKVLPRELLPGILQCKITTSTDIHTPRLIEEMALKNHLSLYIIRKSKANLWKSIRPHLLFEIVPSENKPLWYILFSYSLDKIKTAIKSGYFNGLIKGSPEYFKKNFNINHESTSFYEEMKKDEIKNPTIESFLKKIDRALLPPPKIQQWPSKSSNSNKRPAPSTSSITQPPQPKKPTIPSQNLNRMFTQANKQDANSKEEEKATQKLNQLAQHVLKK